MTFSLIVGPPERCLDGCQGSATSCRATLTGKPIVLSSVLELRELPGVVECSGDCRGSMATCELEGLPAGNYQFGFDCNACTGGSQTWLASASGEAQPRPSTGARIARAHSAQRAASLSSLEASNTPHTTTRATARFEAPVGAAAIAAAVIGPSMPAATP